MASLCTYYAHFSRAGRRFLLAALVGTIVLCPHPTAGSTHDPEPGAVLPSIAGAGAVSLLVDLEGASIAELLASARVDQGTDHSLPPRTTLQSLALALEMGQGTTHAAIESSGQSTVIGAYQVVRNSLLVHSTANEAAAIAGLPGVARVWRIPHHVPDLAESSPHIGAPRVHQELGLDGDGVVVAVVDAGIDYTHAAFGGPGTRMAYDANNENVVEPGSFPTAKVVGGYDLAGHRYSPNCSRLPASFPNCDTVPHPDDDPLEPVELAHGSAIAGVLAGAGSKHVEPGIAPGSTLVALKVYGNPIGAPPATDLTLGAFEWILAHNLGLEVPGQAAPAPIDIANFSLGIPWSIGFPPVEDAVSALTENGVLVVASAGDAGPVPFIVGQPAAASSALSVAASYPPGRGEKATGIEAEWWEQQTRKTLTSAMVEADFTPRLQVVGPITDSLALYGMACNNDAGEPSAPEQDVSGRIALIERGECVFYDKLRNAADLGAIAGLVFTDNRDKIVMSCEPPSDCTNTPAVPAVMIDREPGNKLRDLLRSGVAVTVAMNSELEVPIENLTDTIAHFSSRGPSRGGRLKPDVTGPGAGIFSVLAGGGEWGMTRSGSSLAAPFVSGVAALVAERNNAESLGLGPLDLSAQIINGADPIIKVGDALSGDRAAVARQGAGLVNAFGSATAPVLLRQEGGSISLGFGLVSVEDEPVKLARRLWVQNLSRDMAVYDVDWELAFPDEDAGHGVGLEVDTEEISLAPGAGGLFDVRMTIDPTALREWTLRGFNRAVDQRAVQELEVDGYVTLTPRGNSGGGSQAELVRLPFHVLPRRRACLSSAPQGPLYFTHMGQSRRLSWANSCGIDGQVEGFSLVGLDATESTGDPSFPAVVDIEAVGVRVGPGQVQPEMPLIEWAVSTRGAQRLPIETEIFVYVDTNNDGEFDRVVFNKLGRYVINFPELANKWVVSHAPLVPGTLEPDMDDVSTNLFSQRYDLDESVSVLQVAAADLGIDVSGGTASFGFAVAAFDSANDYALTSTFPGSDSAPDALADGDSYIYSQERAACLELAGDDGQTVMAPQRGLSVAADNTRAVGLKLVCDPLPDGGSEDSTAGFLLSFPGNMPGPDQFAVREYVALNPGSSLYLPHTSQN